MNDYTLLTDTDVPFQIAYQGTPTLDVGTGKFAVALEKAMRGTKGVALAAFGWKPVDFTGLTTEAQRRDACADSTNRLISAMNSMAALGASDAALLLPAEDIHINASLPLVANLRMIGTSATRIIAHFSTFGSSGVIAVPDPASARAAYDANADLSNPLYPSNIYLENFIVCRAHTKNANGFSIVTTDPETAEPYSGNLIAGLVRKCIIKNVIGEGWYNGRYIQIGGEEIRIENPACRYPHNDLGTGGIRIVASRNRGIVIYGGALHSIDDARQCVQSIDGAYANMDIEWVTWMGGKDRSEHARVCVVGLGYQGDDSLIPGNRTCVSRNIYFIGVHGSGGGLCINVEQFDSKTERAIDEIYFIGCNIRSHDTQDRPFVAIVHGAFGGIGRVVFDQTSLLNARRNALYLEGKIAQIDISGGKFGAPLEEGLGGGGTIYAGFNGVFNIQKAIVEGFGGVNSVIRVGDDDGFDGELGTPETNQTGAALPRRITGGVASGNTITNIGCDVSDTQDKSRYGFNVRYADGFIIKDNNKFVPKYTNGVAQPLARAFRFWSTSSACRALDNDLTEFANFAGAYTVAGGYGHFVGTNRGIPDTSLAEVIKTSDESRANTTGTANDGVMIIGRLDPASTYFVDFEVSWLGTAGGLTYNLKLDSLAAPGTTGGATLEWSYKSDAGNDSARSGTTTAVFNAVSGARRTPNSGLITTATDPVSLAFQWGQTTSSPTATSVRAKSFLRVRKAAETVRKVIFDFSGGTVPNGVTVTGGANGRRTDNTGVLVPESAPRFDYDPVSPNVLLGLYCEGEATNSLPVNTALGAVVGVPGTLPTNSTGTTTQHGLSRQVTAIVTESDFTYYRLLISGTATGNGTFNIVTTESTTQVVPSQNNLWIASVFTSLYSGTDPGTMKMAVEERTSTGAIATFSNKPAVTSWPLKLPLVPVASNRASVPRKLTASSTAHLTQSLQLDYISGRSYNFEFWIRLPQLEKRATKYLDPSSPIITAGVAVARSATLISFTNPQASNIAITFDDGAQQVFSAPAGTFTLPAAMRRGRIRRIATAA